MISAYVFFLGSPIFSGVDSGVESGVESGVDSGVLLTSESLQVKNYGKYTNTFSFSDQTRDPWVSSRYTTSLL